MNKEEIDKLFSRIELEKSNDSCGFEFADGYDCTFDNIATCYDDRLKLYDLVKKYKEVIDKLNKYIKLLGKYDGEKCTRGFSMMTADFNKLLEILKEVE